jgi:hypothetical protein
MSSGGHDRYFEVLELSPGASPSEVKRAYSRLMELYSGDSIAVDPLANEFNDSRRREIIKDLEEAYKKITEMFNSHKGTGEQIGLTEKIGAPTGENRYTGVSLRRIREKMRLELHDVALATKVGRNYLENIELENFRALPEAVFVQGYVRAYARCLSLDAQRVTDDYMKRYKDWKNDKK